MDMLKKAALLLIVCLSASYSLYSQYEDDAPRRNPADSSIKNDKTPFDIKENLVPGIEFMLNANSGFFFAELSPFIGIRPVKPLMGGIGVHGSFLGAGGFGNYTYYGGHIFGRLIIADRFFIHGEYRLMNGPIPQSGTLKERVWVTSPIFGAGIMYGTTSYLLLGYATDVQFQQINPFEGLVYRLGFYF